MRRPSIYTERRAGLEIKMTPMIDVVFLLLVFFVWTASFQIVEHVLPSNMSAAQGSEATDIDQPPNPDEDFDPVVVRVIWIGNAPSWKFNDIGVSSLEELHTKLKQLASFKSDTPVILHPDAAVPLGDVIDVFDAVRRAGFEKVQFAASESI